MTLYKFSLAHDGIFREEIEVTEKEKIFEEQKGLNKSRYKKSDLDIVQYNGYNGTPFMISLNGNLEPFINVAIEYKKKQVEVFERKAIKEKNEIIKLKSQFARIINNNIENNTYKCTHFVNFKYDEKDIGKIKGTIGKFEEPLFVPICKVINGDELLCGIQNGEYTIETIKVNHIFIDGSKTNVILRDFENPTITKTIEDPCEIKMTKLKELCKKAKIEIDISFIQKNNS